MHIFTIQSNNRIDPDYTIGRKNQWSLFNKSVLK